MWSDLCCGSFGVGPDSTATTLHHYFLMPGSCIHTQSASIFLLQKKKCIIIFLGKKYTELLFLSTFKGNLQTKPFVVIDCLLRLEQAKSFMKELNGLTLPPPEKPLYTSSIWTGKCVALQTCLKETWTPRGSAPEKNEGFKGLANEGD